MPKDTPFQAKDLLTRFMAWLYSAPRDGRLGALDAAEIDSMAREFSLSGDQLIAVDREGRGASELLRRMMRANGLSYENLRQFYPEIVRDLEIHCSLCAEKKRCRRELVSHDAPEGFADFCPNAPTLVELQARSLQRLV